jgi:adenosylcobinamide hydrolase
MFEATVADGVLQLRREGTRWLSSGYDGGIHDSAVAYNISVPEGWNRSDLDSYVAERRGEAGFERDGPTLLTGVNLDHARGARYGPVEVYATAGISNPAALPMQDTDRSERSGSKQADSGTVNLIVGTDRALGSGALANLLTVVAEAKAATLLAETGFPGTTTDAVVVGCDPAGDPAEYTGSATAVGAATRACTRDAVLASLRSRYPDGEYPATVEAAEHGVRTTLSSEVFRL